MIKIYKIIATFFGIGFIKKGGGTVAAVVYCILWFCSLRFSTLLPVLLIIILITGIWSATEVEKIWGRDNYRVVIDEVMGMAIALLFIPGKIKYVVAALFLFRFFDILKPLGIKRMESLPSGWGVMADDVLAGIYSLVLLHFAIAIKLF